MIEYAIILLTDVADIHKAKRIEVRYEDTEHSIDGEVVRAFVRSTNHAYHDHPHADCLSCGLELIPPAMRSIFEYLYETLREVWIWNEQDSQFE